MTARRRIWLIAGPCRSGTTWLQKSVSADGRISIWQPIKHAIRTKVSPLDHLQSFGSQHDFVIKETFGPYQANEALFNPVAYLRHAFPDHELRIAICFRDFEATRGSWLRSFDRLHEDQAGRNLFFAYLSTLQLLQYAEQLGLERMLYSISRASFSSSESAMDEAICQFFEQDKLEGDFGRVLKQRDPDDFENKGILNAAKVAKKFRYTENWPSDRCSPNDGFSEMSLSIVRELFEAQKSIIGQSV